MVISEHGYIKVYIGRNHPNADSSGYAYEHRYVASRLLGRWPERNEIIHHINGDKKDNRPENLEIVNGNWEHFVHHRKQQDRRSPAVGNSTVSCECGCGTQFKKYDSSGRPRRFVSGHNTEKQERKICACGCGEIVKTRGAKYLLNHWSKRRKKLNSNTDILCLCGCGQILLKYDKWGRPRKYISGHNGGSVNGK